MSNRKQKDMDWQRRIYEQYTKPIYEGYWKDAEIIRLGEHKDKTSEKLDYSGIDVLVRRKNGTSIQLPQRFRNACESGKDFSIRTFVPHANHPTEMERCINILFASDSRLPLYYGFGVVNEKKYDGFSHFYLIKFPELFTLLLKTILNEYMHYAKNDILPYQGPIPNKDDTAGVYIKISDIKKHDLIKEAWNFKSKRMLNSQNEVPF